MVSAKKVVRNADRGQDLKVASVLPWHGGDSTDYLIDLVNDIDTTQPHVTTDSSGQPLTLYTPAEPLNAPKIKTPWTFRSGIFKIRNPADTFSYTFVGGAITANVDLNLPVPVSGTTVNLAALETINVFTQPQTINNYVNLEARTAPATPSASYVRLFNDSADGHLKVKKSDTTLIDLESGGTGGTGGGGGMAAGGVIQRSGTALETHFVIPHGLTPTPELYWAEAVSPDAMSNKTITIDATNIVIDYTIPPPSGTNNLSFHWAAGYITSPGSGGGGMAASGTVQRSGDATQTIFLIPHGLAPQPDLYWAEPTSDDGIGNRKTSIDATNIIVTYGVPPPSGSLNLTYHWAAGYTNSAAGGFTASSITTITNKTVGDFLDINRITIPVDPAANKGRLYVKQIDGNNDGLFWKGKKAGSIVEVQII